MNTSETYFTTFEYPDPFGHMLMRVTVLAVAMTVALVLLVLSRRQ